MSVIGRLATTPEALRMLDDAELREGYFDGRRNDPAPGPNRSDSYVHGWWTGMRDGGHREFDPIDSVIVKAFLSKANPSAAGTASGIQSVDQESNHEAPARLASGGCNGGRHDA